MWVGVGGEGVAFIIVCAVVSEPSMCLVVGLADAGLGSHLDGHVAESHAAGDGEVGDYLPRVFEGHVGGSADADLLGYAEHHVLGVDVFAEAAVDVDLDGLGHT